MNLCRICKINEGVLTEKIKLIIKKKKYLYTYFRCRECNNKCAKHYYASPNGKLNVKRLLKKSYQKYKYKSVARSKLNQKLAIGLIKKPESCQKCFAIGKRLNAHHRDYNKPLDVMWLCTVCHWKTDHNVI